MASEKNKKLKEMFCYRSRHVERVGREVHGRRKGTFRELFLDNGALDNSAFEGLMLCL